MAILRRLGDVFDAFNENDGALVFALDTPGAIYSGRDRPVQIHRNGRAVCQHGLVRSERHCRRDLAGLPGQIRTCANAPVFDDAR